MGIGPERISRPGARTARAARERRMTRPDSAAVGPVTACEAFELDRLPHVLPDFTRVSWVSDRAHGVWEPRIARVGAAWNQIEWRSVVSGVRRCALTSVSS